jgi:TetR/AcrR family fatty acid metabolism transcriptional regulator
MDNPRSSPSPTLLTTEGKAETRERLLQAALTCFANKGYHQTTTDEIVAESALGKGTLYRYFQNKQDLFISLIDWFMLEFDEEISHAWTDDLSAADKIRAMVMVFVEDSEQLIPFFKITVDFWAQTSESDRLQCSFSTWLQRYQQQFGAVIEAGIASGEFRPVNGDQAALALFAMLDAIGLYKTLLGAQIDLHNTVETALEIFLTGLKRWGENHVA